ncbi:glycine--tRNA ligase subunit alpha [Sulfobacillus thermotolerans]|uniref:glycine--tRNA ligase subunit alpha n=1 Tax=Sulfobacillus thermotolerans TaxID=338644 RepID=UPI00336963A3
MMDEIWTIEWAPGVTYDQLFRRAEWEHATYSFEQASSDVLFQLFALYESEAKRLLSLDLIRPGYEYLLKASHIFNTLDALGAISVTERQAYLGRLRTLSRLAATRYLDLRTPKKQEVLS